jgi:hypothetical protein
MAVIAGREGWFIILMLHPCIFWRNLLCVKGSPNCEYCGVYQAISKIIWYLCRKLSWCLTRSLRCRNLRLTLCLGNFVGPQLFKPGDVPAYELGFITVLSAAISAAALAIVYRYLCIWENRRRDLVGMTEAINNAFDDDLTDMKNLQYEYTL